MEFSFPRTIMVPLLAVTLAAGGCSRLSQIGDAPSMSNISNPGDQPEARVVSMPMPTPDPPNQYKSSLWVPGSRTFFRDPRAHQVGDLLTVLIDIEDKAKFNNETKRDRTNTETDDWSHFFGLESFLKKILPDEVNASKVVDVNSSSSTDGNGKIDRNEAISMRVAATVTQVLPNGNFVIAGRQEVRVNFELREIRIAGIIRPEDITNTNTVDYDKVAEARITYGGRGQITDIQQPRYGQQALDIVLPF